jgi:two-component system alkaline phosphatase synthesis response regulator PhoP
MSRTVTCPNCQTAHPVEEPHDESQRVVWCRNCRYPLKLGSDAMAAPSAVKILWIDDDRLLLTFGKDALDRLGYRVLTATDGASGIKMAQQERPDLIIVDVLMPNMDGYEICRRMRADPGLKDTPILLLTALEERMVDLWGREAGATFSMSKPSRPEHIVSIIEWMLSAKLGPPEG